ncbi:MAG: type IV secretion system DNA-binding domain-containing protein [bacterium]|nr:type IV secretion system DNA-binding domain-containing protein [bacterium]
MAKDINIFGQVSFRGSTTRFGIKQDDRRRHMYLVGKTGMGKTTTLENMVISDMVNGHGVGVMDPHGDFAEKMLDFVPKDRIKDVVYFDPADINFPIAFNPLEQVQDEFRYLVASGLMGVFKKIWPDVWSPRMEYILNNALLTMLEFPDSNMLGVQRLLSDKDYRKSKVDQLKDPVIKGFWVNEFSRYSQKFETEATAAIQNKIGQFVANPLVRNILGQNKSALNMRQAIDERKILIFNLSKGKIGEDNSALLGSMIITKLQLAAMSRVDIPEPDRKDFYLYVDEFQNFATDSFANILSEARKYRLCLILAHQYIRQLTHDLNTKVRDAVFGNVGTIITFRVGGEDAEFLEKEFEPDFMATDLVNLAKSNVYIKLMIDGVSSRPFSAMGLPPVPTPVTSYRDLIIDNTRKTYATPLKIVSDKIAKEFLAVPPPSDERFGTEGGGGDFRKPRLAAGLSPRSDGGGDFRAPRPAVSIGSKPVFRPASPAAHQGGPAINDIKPVNSAAPKSSFVEKLVNLVPKFIRPSSPAPVLPEIKEALMQPVPASEKPMASVQAKPAPVVIKAVPVAPISRSPSMGEAKPIPKVIDKPPRVELKPKPRPVDQSTKKGMSLASLPPRPEATAEPKSEKVIREKKPVDLGALRDALKESLAKKKPLE